MDRHNDCLQNGYGVLGVGRNRGAGDWGSTGVCQRGCGLWLGLWLGLDLGSWALCKGCSWSGGCRRRLEVGMGMGKGCGWAGTGAVAGNGAGNGAGVGEGYAEVGGESW